MNIVFRYLDNKWWWFKHLYRAKLHEIFPGLHQWEPNEIPECYPCCGVGPPGVICKICWAYVPDSLKDFSEFLEAKDMMGCYKSDLERQQYANKIIKAFKKKNKL